MDIGSKEHVPFDSDRIGLNGTLATTRNLRASQVELATDPRPGQPDRSMGAEAPGGQAALCLKSVSFKPAFYDTVVERKLRQPAVVQFHDIREVAADQVQADLCANISEDQRAFDRSSSQLDAAWVRVSHQMAEQDGAKNGGPNGPV